MPRFASNISMMFCEWPFEQRYHAAASAGFRAVECWFPYAWPAQEVREWMLDAGVEQVLINAPAGDWINGERGLAALPGREREFREGFEHALSYARVLGCPRINCLTGIADARWPIDRIEATLMANLRWAARLAARYDIDCLLEPINNVDVPDFFLTHIAQAERLINQIAEPNVRLQFDIYHASMMGGDVEQQLERVRDLIAHVQFADAPGRHEPGNGHIDFSATFDALDRIGYG